MGESESKETPQHIYKYMSWDSFIELITQRTLYFAAPTTYNDPFDTKMDITCKGSLDEVRSYWTKQKQSNEWINKVAEISDFQFRKASSEAFMGIVSEFRVCCFSQLFDNILMWSHYSDMHKGVCVKFDRTKDPLFGDATPVSYREQVPKYNLIDGTEEGIRCGIYTKSKDWEYEKEIRIVRHTQQNIANKVKFKRKALCEVILGCRFPDHKKLAVQAIIKKYGYHTALSQMDVSIEEYKLIKRSVNIKENNINP